MAGKQVKLFLVDGTPGGVTTAEITNWTGHVVSGPRSKLAELMGREETKRTGAYLLLGDDPAAIGGTRCYIGEADEIRTRLKEHAGSRGKDFWNRVLIITSKDSNLTKAHGRYLESRLISLAVAAGRSQLENGTSPPTPALPEADVSDMDYFVDQLKIVLPVLGINILRGAVLVEPPHPVVSPVVSPEFCLRVPSRGLDARAVQVDGEFTVLAGSVGAAEVKSGNFAASTSNSYRAFRTIQEKLRADGSLRVDGVKSVFVRDVVFSSPSTAGAIVTGRSCNGRKEWVTSDGIQFGDWEQRGVESSVS